MSMRCTLLIAFWSLLLCPVRLIGLTIQFDYSYDTNRLVTSHIEQFEFVAAEFEQRIHDQLLAIAVPPTSIVNPSTGEYVSVGQPIHVPADTIIVYVGAYDLPADRLAQAYFDFSSTPNNRGQGAMDLGIWTGSIAFDSLTNWQEYHIYSVLRHELLHVLGFGLAPAFFAQVSNGHFLGPVAIAEYGGPVPLSADIMHLAVDSSISLVEGWPRAPVLSATLQPQARRYLTRLDLAVLADLGWEVELPPLVAGDYNDNGTVDAADYVLWRQNLGTINDLRNDTTGVRAIGTAQYNLWWANFGKPINSPGHTAHLPEPSALTLSLVFVAVGVGRVSAISRRNRWMQISMGKRRQRMGEAALPE
jgi:hypothetical protein